MKKIIKTIKKNYIELLLLLIIIVLIVSSVLVINNSADFIAINGDFQNYNPVRRLLDKQIPYKDFSDYLGN